MEKNYNDILNNIKETKVLVIGDLMLDKFVYGDASRISIEAPIPIVNVKKIEYNPGGAGNTASNVASLGGNAIVIGVIGDDDSGKILLNEFDKRNILAEGVFVENSRPTTEKTRILGGTQQMIRVDYEKDYDISKDLEDKIIDYLSNNINDIETIIVSDYAKGTITEDIAKRLVYLKFNNKNVLVDTKPKHADFYKNVTLVKPNLREAIEITGKYELADIGFGLVEKFNSDILITKGKEGMSLFTKNGDHISMPTKAREVYDVSGAGDTVIAMMGLALNAKASLEDAVKLANIAAGLAVERRGIVSVRLDEIRDYLGLYVVPKVWGEEHWLVNDDYCGKRLILKKGYRCSLHHHKLKDETFYVARGKVLLELNNKKIEMNPGDLQRIRPNEIHRFSGLEDSEIIEFSTHHDENDVYRIEPSGVMDKLD